MNFYEAFNMRSQVQASAPGRVNIVGEHTDYNEGFVLPIAIPQYTTVEIGYSHDDHDYIYAQCLNQYGSYKRSDPIEKGFSSYVTGCVRVLEEQGYKIPSLMIHIDSQVPIGVGLSSSAALEVAMLRALRELLTLNIDDIEIAKLAQRAEINYAGVRCGIMDQMASSLADKERMLFLDARTLDYKLIPLPPNSELIVIDSGIPRELSTSMFNQRRSECEEAAKILGIEALRDANDLQEIEKLSLPLNRRARHVFNENRRVLEASQGVDATRLGELMNETHLSLRDDYEVSIPPLDLLVSLLQKQTDVYGAKLTGAGFGGACVALVKKETGSAIAKTVVQKYNGSGYAGAVLIE